MTGSDEAPRLDGLHDTARSGQAAEVAMPAAALDTPVGPTSVPAAPMVASLCGHEGGRTVLLGEFEGVAIEQYRNLCARLHALKAERGVAVIMVSSAVSGEGKTLTATNLALTLSESYQRRVLLMDGDLRRPSLHELFAFDGPSTSGNGSTRDAPLHPAVHYVSPYLAVLTAGRAADPMAFLTSPRLHGLVRGALQQFDWVLIDTPPIAVLPDANLITAMADGTLLVVEAGKTPLRLIQRAVDLVGRERILGVVLNRVDKAGMADMQRYAYQYIPPRTRTR